jgi:(4S)-4-hydroxy-5-phosphonooxypentane-2,3-dione isomerase
MKLMIVHIKVLPEMIDEFAAASLENSGHSREEPGVTRFELLQDETDPCRFVLIEGYRDDSAMAAHKLTAHYLKWKELAEPMMAEPRTRTVYLVR